MIKGLKEVKKAAKLFNKKAKIDNKINNLAKKYYNQVSIKSDDNDYFLELVKDYIKQSQK